MVLEKKSTEGMCICVNAIGCKGIVGGAIVRFKNRPFENHNVSDEGWSMERGKCWWFRITRRRFVKRNDIRFTCRSGSLIKKIKGRRWLWGLEYLPWNSNCLDCILIGILLLRLPIPTNVNTGTRGQSVCESLLLTQWPSLEDVGYPFL